MSLRVYAFSNGRLELNLRLFVPTIQDSTRIQVPVPCILIQHPDGNVLFDSGCHPDTIHDAASRWGGIAKAFTVVAEPGDEIASQLQRFGLDPSDVHIVVNSHLHMDHCGSNQFFPRAKVYLQAAELAAARDPANDGAGYFRADWDHGQETVELDGEHDLFGDGKLRIIQTHGHTPGHQSLVVMLERSRPLILVGDACYTQRNLTEDVLPKVTWDPAQHKAAYQRLREERDALGAELIMGHDPWQWPDIRPAPDYYYE